MQTFSWRWMEVFCITSLFLLVLPGLLFRFVVSMPKFPIYTTEWWSVVGLSGIFLAIVYWLIVEVITPPMPVLFLRQFIRDYRRLSSFLEERRWQPPPEYLRDSIHSQDDFERMEMWVREKLTILASGIKVLERQLAGDLSCEYGGRIRDPKILRKQFGYAFDTWKPFGLVYPTYDPYFNPEASYFFG